MEFQWQALQHGLSEAELMSDSQATISALIAKTGPLIWSLMGIFFHILEDMKLFSDFKFTWVPRTLNVSAHNLCVWERKNMNFTILID